MVSTWAGGRTRVRNFHGQDHIFALDESIPSWRYRLSRGGSGRGRGVVTAGSQGRPTSWNGGIGRGFRRCVLQGFDRDPAET